MRYKSLALVRYILFLVVLPLTFAFLFLIQSDKSFASEQDKLKLWLSELKSDALSMGITETTFDNALADFVPNKRVIELDRNQPEFTVTLDDYLKKRVTSTKIAKAKELSIKHKKILTEISQHYNVQSRFIVAIWGLETNFGQYLGKFHTPKALATLAYDGRRGAFFRKELFNALQIIEEGHITADDMYGAWAGAIGQVQFLPSSFLKYAQDWDNDGRKDIWTNEKDAFASIAFYLKSVGWRDDITWGRQVKLPIGIEVTKLVKSRKQLTLREWKTLGIKNLDGSELPTRNLKARLVKSTTSNLIFLGYGNFDSILKWNRSIFFASSVGLLSDALR